MMRIILGIILTLAVQAIGWPRIQQAFERADTAAKAAYTAAEKEVKR